MNTFDLQSLPENMIPWVYSNVPKVDEERQCIGHLRGDFDRDDAFWSSWFPHCEEFYSEEFKNEFNRLVTELRKKERILHDFSTMRKMCREYTDLQDMDSRGAAIVTDRFLYAFRFIPIRGNYNVYIYCYDREGQEVTKK